MENPKGILEAKLQCPECGMIVKVEDAVVDGDVHWDGYTFDSDGSLGCPKCFWVMKKHSILKDVEYRSNQ